MISELLGLTIKILYNGAQIIEFSQKNQFKSYVIKHKEDMKIICIFVGETIILLNP